MIELTRTRRGLGRPETARLVKRAVDCALRSEGAECECLIYVTLTDDETIREINREQRGIDRATDVLSFPMNELTPGKFDEDLCERDPESGAVFLGDMVISVPRCAEQGEEYGHGYAREVSYLAVHSTLHLLGYDHMEDSDRALMREREDKIMETLGIGR